MVELCFFRRVGCGIVVRIAFLAATWTGHVVHYLFTRYLFMIEFSSHTPGTVALVGPKRSYCGRVSYTRHSPIFKYKTSVGEWQKLFS
jgi:hypothetical protein